MNNGLEGCGYVCYLVLGECIVRIGELSLNSECCFWMKLIVVLKNVVSIFALQVRVLSCKGECRICYNNVFLAGRL